MELYTGNVTDSIVLWWGHYGKGTFLIETAMDESMIAKNQPPYQEFLGKTEAANSKPGSKMLTQVQWTITAQKLRLTKREREVCEELFEGNTRNKIAEHLGIKPRTVRHYMEHIHQKLAVSNRVGVVLRIIQMRDQITSSDIEAISETDTKIQPPSIRPEE